MSLFLNDQQKVNEIIFTNRNKAYGAYTIRSEYGTTVFKSLCIVTCSMFSVTGILVWLNKQPIVVPNITAANIPVIVPVDMTKVYETAVETPKKANPTEIINPPKPASLAGIATHIVDSLPMVATEIKSLTLGVSSSSGTTSEGTAVNGSGTASSSIGAGANGAGVEASTTPTEIFKLDELPEFEGGLGALKRFVASKINYPNVAREAAIQGTLYVKFVVDESGQVGEVVMENNLGYGLEQEASRVIKLIPRFKKPGKIKGQAVKTYYQLPIRFTIN